MEKVDDREVYSFGIIKRKHLLMLSFDYCSFKYAIRVNQKDTDLKLPKGSVCINNSKQSSGIKGKISPNPQNITNSRSSLTRSCLTRKNFQNALFQHSSSLAKDSFNKSLLITDSHLFLFKNTKE
jgi:hypothetical protein